MTVINRISFINIVFQVFFIIVSIICHEYNLVNVFNVVFFFYVLVCFILIAVYSYYAYLSINNIPTMQTFTQNIGENYNITVIRFFNKNYYELYKKGGAYVNYENNKIYMLRFLYDNINTRKFIILHEVGHFTYDRDTAGIRSKEKEYRADLFAAKYAGKETCIKALKYIHKTNPFIFFSKGSFRQRRDRINNIINNTLESVLE